MPIVKGRVFFEPLWEALFFRAPLKVRELGVLGALHPYRLRHTGASHDFASSARDLPSVQRRGRWKDKRSLRRYEKGGASLRTPPMAASRDAAACGPVRAARRGGGTWPALAVPRSVKEAPVFLELFSGSSRLGKAIAAMGWTVILWDILLGPQYDLRSRRNRSTVVQWVRGSWVRAWHAGFPCNSFSRARDRPGGPPWLRSDAEPRGLKNLRACDQAAVELGNLLLSFTVNLNMVSILFRIPFTLENPALSRAWICPPMPTLLRRRCVSQHVVEYCRFGRPWRKSIRFVAYLV